MKTISQKKKSRFFTIKRPIVYIIVNGEILEVFFLQKLFEVLKTKFNTCLRCVIGIGTDSHKIKYFF